MSENFSTLLFSSTFQLRSGNSVFSADRLFLFLKKKFANRIDCWENNGNGAEIYSNTFEIILRHIGRVHCGNQTWSLFGVFVVHRWEHTRSNQKWNENSFLHFRAGVVGALMAGNGGGKFISESSKFSVHFNRCECCASDRCIFGFQFTFSRNATGVEPAVNNPYMEITDILQCCTPHAPWCWFHSETSWLYVKTERDKRL